MSDRIVRYYIHRYGEETIANSFVHLIEYSRSQLSQEKETLAQKVYLSLIDEGLLRFCIIGNDLGFHLPQKRRVRKSRERLTKTSGEQLEKTLFEMEPKDSVNESLEKPVAWHLEDQQHVFFWLRNVVKQDYSIQGWRKHKSYPDFLAAVTCPESPFGFERIYALETKGKHLKGSDDSDYKRDVFKLCNQLAKKIKWEDLGFDYSLLLSFHWLDEENWQQIMTGLFPS